jgi:hypothetical protein
VEGAERMVLGGVAGGTSEVDGGLGGRGGGVDEVGVRVGTS